MDVVVTMRFRFWRAVDAVAHFLYAPAMLGRRIAVHHRGHDVHLIPGSWLACACERAERE